MKISISNNDVNFKPVILDNVDHLARLMLETNYSPAVYKNNYRKISNFVSAEVIGIDVDNEKPEDNYTIEDAHEKFKDYKHIIATTKSHRKDKHGKVADRFRIILFLDKEITDPKDYKETWLGIYSFYPAADAQCKDAARYFYPSLEVYSKNPKPLILKMIREREI